MNSEHVATKDPDCPQRFPNASEAASKYRSCYDQLENSPSSNRKAPEASPALQHSPPMTDERGPFYLLWTHLENWRLCIS